MKYNNQDILLFCFVCILLLVLVSYIYTNSNGIEAFVGEEPAAPPLSNTLPLTWQYAGREVSCNLTLTNNDSTRNNDVPNVVYVFPGSKVEYKVSMVYEGHPYNVYCPGCLVQYYISMNENETKNVFTKCLSLNYTNTSTGRTLIKTDSFTAPNILGAYYIQPVGQLNYKCGTLVHVKNKFTASTLGTVIVIPQKTTTTFANPTTTYANPTTTYANPTTTFANPTTTYANPTTTYANPTTTYANPTTTYANPTTTYANPTTTYANPTTTYANPTTTYANPSTTYANPTTTYANPSTTYANPSTTKYEPTRTPYMPPTNTTYQEVPTPVLTSSSLNAADSNNPVVSDYTVKTPDGIHVVQSDYEGVGNIYIPIMNS